MSVEVVKETDIEPRKGRPKYSEFYEKWFTQVLSLKQGEVLKIVFSEKSRGTFPTPVAVRFAVNRFNTVNPTKKIEMTWRNARSSEPSLYLSQSRVDEVSKDSKKSNKS